MLLQAMPVLDLPLFLVVLPGYPRQAPVETSSLSLFQSAHRLPYHTRYYSRALYTSR